MLASAIIADVRSLLTGDPVFLTGSLVTEDVYGLTNAHSDVDLFAPSDTALIAVGQKLLSSGYTFAPRFDRVWNRWLSYGFNSWHTNSLRLVSPIGIETNLVYKTIGRHPVKTLAEVLESFDFGLLAMGYDLKSNTFRDMRSYLFPGMDPYGPLPMMPDKRTNWRQGLFSQYNGLRELGRYAKYAGYGYDMSLVKDDLATGYRESSYYHRDHFDHGKQQLGLFYEAIAAHIELDHVSELALVAKKVDYTDSLDSIMEALE